MGEAADEGQPSGEGSRSSVVPRLSIVLPLLALPPRDEPMMVTKKGSKGQLSARAPKNSARGAKPSSSTARGATKGKASGDGAAKRDVNAKDVPSTQREGKLAAKGGKPSKEGSSPTPRKSPSPAKSAAAAKASASPAANETSEGAPSVTPRATTPRNSSKHTPSPAKKEKVAAAASRDGIAPLHESDHPLMVAAIPLSVKLMGTKEGAKETAANTRKVPPKAFVRIHETDAPKEGIKRFLVALDGELEPLGWVQAGTKKAQELASTKALEPLKRATWEFPLMRSMALLTCTAKNQGRKAGDDVPAGGQHACSPLELLLASAACVMLTDTYRWQAPW